ncbi:MAG: hypothetical protein M0P69_12680 [Bacteroidales bacterium]|jgi:hypothetical protein|nr:hypothetical protein [Bacteroidales bacterium]
MKGKTMGERNNIQPKNYKMFVNGFFNPETPFGWNFLVGGIVKENMAPKRHEWNIEIMK